MKPINTLNQSATTHVGVKPSNRKAKMVAKFNRYMKRVALVSEAQYK